MSQDDVLHPRLERQGRKFGRVGERFSALWFVLFLPGILLVVLASGWAYDLGWVLVAFSLLPAMVAGALLVSAAVARWTARERPFA
jgi:hypothetical protein